MNSPPIRPLLRREGYQRGKEGEFMTIGLNSVRIPLATDLSNQSSVYGCLSCIIFRTIKSSIKLD